MATGLTRETEQEGQRCGISMENLLTGRFCLCALLVIMLGLIGMFAHGLKQGRDQRLSRAATDNENIARALEEYVAAVIQKADLALFSVSAEAGYTHPRLTPEKLQSYREKSGSDAVEAHGLLLTDAAGYSAANGSGGDRNLRYHGDRPYFTRQRDNPSLGLFISEPLHDSVSGWQIVISRRLNKPDGRFTGVALATIPLSCFEGFFGSLNLGRNSNIALVNRDLYLVARFPSKNGQRLKSLKGGPLDVAMAQTKARQGSFRGKSVVDGVARVCYYRRVGNLPFIIVVGQAEQDILAEWRSNAWLSGAGLAALLFAIGLLTCLLLARVDRERESGRRLREVTSTLGEGVYVLDKNGLVTFVNPEMERLLGWSEAELLGRDGHEVFHYKKPDGTPLPAEDCPVHQTISTGLTYRVLDDWMVHKNGAIIPISMVSTPIFRNGEITGSVAAFQDISRRLEREKALRESEERFHLLFDSANDAILVQRMEVDLKPGKFIEANRVASQILGYSRQEFLEMTPGDLEDPDSAGDVPEVTDRLIATRHALFERVYLAKSGDRIPVEISTHAFLLQGQPTLLSIVRDISERKKAEQEYRSILQTAMDGFLVADAGDFRLLDVNQACCKMLGYTREELLRLRIPDLEERESAEEIAQHVAEIRTSGHALFETLYRCKNGRLIDVEVSATYLDIHGGRIIVFVRDISKRKKAEEEIRRLADFDPLTALPNRRLLMDRLKQALFQARRYQRPLAVMFLDLDNFKQINDTLGHDVGDELLKVAADRLTACVRNEDTVARLGGDEFVVVLAEITDIPAAELVAEKIVRSFEEPMLIDKHEIRISTSLGIAIYPVNGRHDAQKLMKMADIALYAAKAAGRNRFLIYQEAIE